MNGGTDAEVLAAIAAIISLRPNFSRGSDMMIFEDRDTMARRCVLDAEAFLEAARKRVEETNES